LDSVRRRKKPAEKQPSSRFDLQKWAERATSVRAILLVIGAAGALVVAVLSFATGFLSEEPREPAEAFASRAIHDYFTDQDRYYDVLHPAEKQRVPKQFFMLCREYWGSTADLGSSTKIGEYTRPLRRPDIGDRLATGVRFKLELDRPRGHAVERAAVLMVPRKARWYRIGTSNGWYRVFVEREYEEWTRALQGVEGEPTVKDCPR
jgi:hypothetical protein